MGKASGVGKLNSSKASGTGEMDASQPPLAADEAQPNTPEDGVGGDAQLQGQNQPRVVQAMVPDWLAHLVDPLGIVQEQYTRLRGQTHSLTGR